MPSSTRVDQHPHWNAQPDATQALGAYQEYGMSNVSTLIDYAKTLTEDQAGEALLTLGIVPNTAPHDDPDQYGAVQARDMRPGRHESKSRWITQDIVDTLPEGPTKAFAQHQIDIANGWFNIDQATKVWAAHDAHAKNIPGVMAAASVNKRDGSPIFPTLESLVKAVNSEPDDSTGSGIGFHG